MGPHRHPRSSPLALGGNVFGWTADLQQSFALLDAFVDAGFNLIDTADAVRAIHTRLPGRRVRVR
jgi:aryl-alcohol dehydrogenase-like predicted oxidoreductase